MSVIAHYVYICLNFIASAAHGTLSCHLATTRHYACRMARSFVRLLHFFFFS